MCLALRPIYGGSDHLLDHGLTGCQVEWVKPEDVARKVRPETRLDHRRDPGQPDLEVAGHRAAGRRREWRAGAD